MGSTSLPHVPSGKGYLNPVDMASAIMGLRFDKIVSVKWDIRPSVGIVAKDINRLGIDIRSFREPLTRCVKLVMIPSIRKNFTESGRPPWEPLAENTIRHRKGSAWPILQVTGKLRKRATQLNIWDIGMTTATIRRLPNDAFYGVFHQAGAGGASSNSIIPQTTAPRNKGVVSAADMLAEINENGGDGWKLPARPFIMYQDSDIVKMQAIFLDWMEERAIRVGRFHKG